MATISWDCLATTAGLPEAFVSSILIYWYQIWLVCSYARFSVLKSNNIWLPWKARYHLTTPILKIAFRKATIIILNKNLHCIFHYLILTEATWNRGKCFGRWSRGPGFKSHVGLYFKIIKVGNTAQLSTTTKFKVHHWIIIFIAMCDCKQYRSQLVCGIECHYP